MRALILEDDLGFALDIEILLREIGILKVDIVANSDKATQYIQASPPDILLLDIKVKGSLNGIEFYEKYQSYCSKVVFFTAYKDEVIYQQVRAFTNAPYIIKPFDQLTLKAAIESVLQQHTQNTTYITIKKKKEYIRLSLEDIVWIKSEGNYAYIHTWDKKYVLKRSIKKLMANVKDNVFLPIHKGIIVNPDYIQSVNFSDNTLKINGQELPIGRTYRREIRLLLKL
ncbi:MAG: LytTR family DNA-binding domain-containing protein [Bacteroidota bacterium]